MTPLAQDQAELLALETLTWLVGNDELLPVFMGASGVGESDLRQRARDPDLLASVLDFLLMDDAWISAFCDSANHTYDMPLRARAGLPGGAQVNWT